MRKRVFLLFVLLLASCGGGGDRAPVVAFYGDSLTSGHLQGAPGRRLDVTPPERLQQLLGDRAQVRGFAEPGATPAAAIAGSELQPVLPFAQHLAEIRPAVVVLRYGGVGAVWGDDVDQVAGEIRELVRLARSTGAQVVIAGLTRQTDWDARLQLFDDMLRRVATECGVPFADTRALPIGEYADAVHPAQAYADAMVVVIAIAVMGVL
jgi:hypothetical protein